jgi:hypothetical protein
VLSATPKFFFWREVEKKLDYGRVILRDAARHSLDLREVVFIVAKFM